MDIIDSILGNTSEPDWKARLQGASIDWLELSQWDAQKNRFRKTTKEGRELAVALERGQSLRDGDVLDWNEDSRKAVVCRIRLCPVMVVDMQGLTALPREEALAAAVKLGHALGNQHWPAVVKGSMVYVPVSTDSNVMGSVMDTHALLGTSYAFLAGEDVLDLLEQQEVRRLFGGAEQPGGHHHHHEEDAILRHGFGREHCSVKHGRHHDHGHGDTEHGGIPYDDCGRGRGPHGRRHRCRRHHRYGDA